MMLINQHLYHIIQIIFEPQLKEKEENALVSLISSVLL